MLAAVEMIAAKSREVLSSVPAAHSPFVAPIPTHHICLLAVGMQAVSGAYRSARLSTRPRSMRLSHQRLPEATVTMYRQYSHANVTSHHADCCILLSLASFTSTTERKPE